MANLIALSIDDRYNTQSEWIKKPVRSHLNDFLDAAEERGKLNLRTEEISMALPKVSAEALRQALQRQQKKGRIVRASRGSGHWVVVPRQDASVGAPPLEAWLDAFLSKTLKLPYYVGLLSAAEIHGASPQAVMVTQVMLGKTRRPVQIGRHQLVFQARAHPETMPTQWHETPLGRVRVSTPELTAVELVSRQQDNGGIARVLEIITGLAPGFTPEGLHKALDAVQEVPTAQRLGFLLEKAGYPALADLAQTWLAGKRIRAIALSPGEPPEEPCTINTKFKVFTPNSLQSTNS